MWVAKLPLLWQCNLCETHTRDVLLHSVTECPCLRPYTNVFLVYITTSKLRISMRISTVSKRRLLVKLLGLQFDTNLRRGREM